MSDPSVVVAAREGRDSALCIPAVAPIPSGGEIRSFLLGSMPVTNREYAPLVASGIVTAPPWWSHQSFRGPLQPVVGVTWREAKAFCSWLSDADGSRWRLPTEAEWEWASCGGLSAPRTSWGDAIPPGEIPEGLLSGPWETGRGTPNGYGLNDMGTIVHEWCLDEVTGRPGRRASRGGSWRHEIRWSGPAARSSLPADSRYSDYGFRVLRELERDGGNP